MSLSELVEERGDFGGRGFALEDRFLAAEAQFLEPFGDLAAGFVFADVVGDNVNHCARTRGRKSRIRLLGAQARMITLLPRRLATEARRKCWAYLYDADRRKTGVFRNGIRRNSGGVYVELIEVNKRFPVRELSMVVGVRRVACPCSLDHCLVFGRKQSSRAVDPFGPVIAAGGEDQDL